MLGALEPPSSGTVNLKGQNPFLLNAKQLAAFRNQADRVCISGPLPVAAVFGHRKRADADDGLNHKRRTHDAGPLNYSNKLVSQSAWTIVRLNSPAAKNNASPWLAR